MYFHVVDYIIFILVIIISLGIGIFFGSVKKQTTTDSFLVGERSMGLLPVTGSLILTFYSAITVLGTPAEMYYQGTMFIMGLLGLGLACVIASVFFVPLFYHSFAVSCYKYLEERFDSTLMLYVGNALYLLISCTYMGVAQYGPSLALETVTGIQPWISIVTCSIIVIIYTALGGIKGVIWADCLQAVVMLGGLVAVLIRGTIEVGGFSEVVRLNSEWNRFQWFDFTPDLTKRQTFWSLLFGYMTVWLVPLTVNQAAIQRYKSLPTLKKARISAILLFPGSIIIQGIAAMVGIVAFAYYAKQRCDPLAGGIITNPNQILPYFVVDVMRVPGLPGLFVACLVSASLSTLSSILNSISTVVWEDLVKPRLSTAIAQNKAIFCNRIITLIVGIISIFLSLIILQVGGLIIQLGVQLGSIGKGPLFGLFCAAAFVPWTNKGGALVGVATATVFSSVLAFGSMTMPKRNVYLPTPTDGCNITGSGNSSSQS